MDILLFGLTSHEQSTHGVHCASCLSDLLQLEKSYYMINIYFNLREDKLKQEYIYKVLKELSLFFDSREYVISRLAFHKHTNTLNPTLCFLCKYILCDYEHTNTVLVDVCARYKTRYIPFHNIQELRSIDLFIPSHDCVLLSIKHLVFPINVPPQLHVNDSVDLEDLELVRMKHRFAFNYPCASPTPFEHISSISAQTAKQRGDKTAICSLRFTKSTSLVSEHLPYTIKPNFESVYLPVKHRVPSATRSKAGKHMPTLNKKTMLKQDLSSTDDEQGNVRKKRRKLKKMPQQQQQQQQKKKRGGGKKVYSLPVEEEEDKIINVETNEEDLIMDNDVMMLAADYDPFLSTNSKLEVDAMVNSFFDQGNKNDFKIGDYI